MWLSRQDGHQQPAFAPGTGTTAGSFVHQHGSMPPSAMAQPKVAPQRVHLFIIIQPGRNAFAMTIVQP